MKDTFRCWSNVDVLNLDATMNLILTGRTAKNGFPSEELFKYIGDKSKNLKILDFGCGIGRNTFGLNAYSPNWTIIGYDNENMIKKTEEFHASNYSNNIPPSVKFYSEWDIVKTIHFDVIFCCLVLQHIFENILFNYISNFKIMANKLVVSGRRFNDDTKKRSNWSILEDNGLVPHKFYLHQTQIEYMPEGHPEDHNTAIYLL
jgi:SAM-dependent methyltransferase